MIYNYIITMKLTSPKSVGNFYHIIPSYKNIEMIIVYCIYNIALYIYNIYKIY